MKNYFSVLLLLSLFAFSCTKDRVDEHYTFFRPVYATKETVKNNIKSSAAELLQNPGKLVIKDHILYLNDLDKGIHVIDISDPAKLKNLAFIHIPGCIDMAVKGNYLYADCYTDLVVMDITNPLQVTVKQDLPGVFPHRFYNHFMADTAKVIQQWVRVDTVVSHRFSQTLDYSPRRDGLLFSASSFAMPSTGAGLGIAGSMARFALLNQRLYTVSSDDLKVFNVTREDKPSFVKSVDLQNGNIETIFPYTDKLFIGSQTGMFIYDAGNPDQPVKLGQFMHSRSCDPVIADGRYAYVTLRSGNFCGGVNNQLDVIDINQLTSPQLVKSYSLTSPAGLSKDGKLLLICDGKEGLKIMDANDPAAVNLLGRVPGIDAYDVIALNGTALVVAKDGVYTIDYTNPAQPRILDRILKTENK